MLTDKSNLYQTIVTSDDGSTAMTGGKRSWEEQQDGGEDLLPNKLRMKKRLGESSSSSSTYNASSSPFPNTRFEAYDAPSSPLSTSLSKSLSRAVSALPPSSPPPAGLLDEDEGIPDFVARTATSTNAKPKLSPITGLEGEPLTLRLEENVVMQFGRKAKRHQPDLPNLDELTQTLPILLPQSAKNASRLHATVRIVSSSTAESESGSTAAKVEVRVMGQNGMKIDGKLHRGGSVALLSVAVGQKLALSFWGWSAIVIILESRLRPATMPAAPSTPAARLSSPFDSLFDGDVASSSLLGDLEEEEEEDEEMGQLDVHSRAASPSPAPSDLSVLSALSSSPMSQHAALPSPSALSSTTSKAYSLLESLSLDLPGLIASAIVFHPRSTVSVEEVTKALLREVGGMWDVLPGGKGREADGEREDEAVEAWWDIVESTLQDQPFFGCIANVGLRDAMGAPVPPAYFYNPDQDPSASRVAALEPFVKRVRGARTAGGGKRYFWRKPSIKKIR